MNSPSRPRPRQAQAPRDYDDGPVYHNSTAKAGPSGAPRFDSHDDFYDFLDNNRGPISGPSSQAGPSNNNTNTNASATMQAQPPQMPQQQQRFGQGGPAASHSPTSSRPPLTNSFPPQGGGSGSDRPRPPSYSGSSRSEEMLVAGADRSRDGDGARVQRQNGRRGGPSKPVSGPRPPTSSSGGSSPPRTSAGYAPNHPQLQQAQAQAKSASASDPNLAIPGASLGASIQRLKSPSVLDCVLQPLDQKVREYSELMHREQDEMDRLDAEIRVLQERRADAETRFLEAKGKHDDYQRQYIDVDRAMRGEALPPPISRDQQVPLSRQHTRPMSMQEEEDDDEDDLMPPPSSHRRINSQQSFGRSSQKMKGGSRFRFSLFGDK